MVFVPVHCLGNTKVSDQRVTEKIGLADKVCAGGPLVCCSLSKLVTRSSTFIVKMLQRKARLNGVPISNDQVSCRKDLTCRPTTSASRTMQWGTRLR